jgi:hypothetical protein
VVGSARPVSEGKRTKSERPLTQTLLTKPTAILCLANRSAVAMKMGVPNGFTAIRSPHGV